MPWDSWYDLTIRELSDLSDPAKEKLAQAAETALPEPLDDDEEETPEESAPSRTR